MKVLFLFVLLYISDIFCDYAYYKGSKCPGYSFRCLNGQCIPSTSVCDGKLDCEDKSDERNSLCTEYASLCPPYAFRCAYGACVDKFRICDGIQNCADNSDELLPQCFKANLIIKKCKLYEFECDSGQCINETSICDGNRDCSDGSDETITHCVNFKCPEYGFQCAYGGCINKIKKCDDEKDCKDGSDEDAELCSTNNIQRISTTPKPNQSSWIYIGCRLPPNPQNGKYEVGDCIEGDSTPRCRKEPGAIVNPNDALKYSCDPGFVLSEDSNPILCTRGTWNPEPPSCLRLCEGLHSYSMELNCHYRGRKVDCGKAVRPGTELEAKCNRTYHSRDPSASFFKTKCLPEGSWQKKLYECLPDCGIKNTVNKQIPLISNGLKVMMSEYPWHAAFYLINGENIDYKCGGSIIHPKAVLTAAHCVFDEKAMSLRDKRKMIVAVGKYWSDWNHKGDINTTQAFRVIDIRIRKRYRGLIFRLEDDIAILHLDKLITLSPAVMPICLDKRKSFRLDQSLNPIGTVVGSGAMKPGGEVSKELRVARFPVLSLQSCEKFNSSYLTHDKFCAVLSNGTSVLEGDSGSGMTFPMLTDGKEQHFIYGIVSYKSVERDDFAAFTNVTVHMEWIEEVLDEIELSLKKI